MIRLFGLFGLALAASLSLAACSPDQQAAFEQKLKDFQARELTMLKDLSARYNAKVHKLAASLPAAILSLAQPHIDALDKDNTDIQAATTLGGALQTVAGRAAEDLTALLNLTAAVPGINTVAGPLAEAVKIYQAFASHGDVIKAVSGALQAAKT
jgi:hypothetical protein